MEPGAVIFLIVVISVVLWLRSEPQRRSWHEMDHNDLR